MRFPILCAQRTLKLELTASQSLKHNNMLFDLCKQAARHRTRAPASPSQGLVPVYTKLRSLKGSMLAQTRLSGWQHNSALIAHG